MKEMALDWEWGKKDEQIIPGWANGAGAGDA
jgi:hypothetical protein